MVAHTFSKWMMKSTQRKWSFFFSLSFVIITNKILHFSSLTFVLIQFTLFHWSNYPMIDVYYKIKRKTKYLTWKRYRIIAALRKQIEFKTHANFWPNLTFVCFGALLFFPLFFSTSLTHMDYEVSLVVHVTEIFFCDAHTNWVFERWFCDSFRSFYIPLVFKSNNW